MGRAPKICSEKSCHALVYDPSRRRCEEHHVPWANHYHDPERGKASHKRLRHNVLADAGYRCQIGYPGICTGIATDLDRIDNTRGYDAVDNLQAACSACHARKSSAEGHVALGHRVADLP